MQIFVSWPQNFVSWFLFPGCILLIFGCFWLKFATIGPICSQETKFSNGMQPGNKSQQGGCSQETKIFKVAGMR
ncbi:hypothetical protein [Gulosibacter hominis]|uniref:hypothetical protein n=1 Tax=Gulosibacter hominis TaxID=2770504 RepID=UPI001919A122|nr:hypothetical protein [Gulosibacter hominis]